MQRVSAVFGSVVEGRVRSGCAEEDTFKGLWLWVISTHLQLLAGLKEGPHAMSLRLFFLAVLKRGGRIQSGCAEEDEMLLKLQNMWRRWQHGASSMQGRGLAGVVSKWQL
jgi:hypothetical protein